MTQSASIFGLGPNGGGGGGAVDEVVAYVPRLSWDTEVRSSFALC